MMLARTTRSFVARGARSPRLHQRAFGIGAGAGDATARLGRRFLWGAAAVGGTIAATLAFSHTPLELDAAPVRKEKDELQLISAREVLKHAGPESVWVVVDDEVWDVTSIVPTHPGGSQAILSLAARDATSAFLPIHPSGTLPSNLPPTALKGRIDPTDAYLLAQSLPLDADALAAVQARREALPPLGAVVNLDEFEGLAREVLGEKSSAWGFYYSWADDGKAFKANRESWDLVRFRPRVLKRVAEVDPSTTFLGHPSPLPIFIAPAARAGAGHPLGERTLTRGAAATGIVQGISSSASLGLNEILDERDRVKEESGKEAALWFQLYVDRDHKRTEEVVKQAVAGGAKAILLTVDLPVLGKREADRRSKAALGAQGDAAVWSVPYDADLNWEDISWLKSVAPGVPIMLKGVATAEDAALAKAHGCAGVILSNHGGRQLDGAPPPLATLLEIRCKHPELLRQDGHGGRFEVYVDGGVRRGADVLKALALGAKGVGLGRPFLYAQSCYGEAGVKRVVSIMEEEIQTGLRLLGVKSLAELGPQHVVLLDGLLGTPVQKVPGE